MKSHASSALIEKLIVSYKRGKFIETVYGKFSNMLSKSEASLKKAVATKYLNFLSRRKYAFSCKIQKATFEPSNERWNGNKITYGDQNINLRAYSMSHKAVDSFVKALDIGDVHQITGYSGVTRTVTALITMIVHLNLTVTSLRKNLMWFNGNTNHFVVEFSDDGAPESKEVTMTIGTLTLWNFGNRVRSREFHYLLDLISTTEKYIVCESLWKQHTDEMTLIKSNVVMINGEKITFKR